MDSVSKALLLVAAMIHLLPLLGLCGRERLSRLYGVEISDPNLLILMQHRAVLFGLVGAVLILAVFWQQWRNAALIVGLISAVSFLLIAGRSGGYNAALKRVVQADIVAVFALIGVVAIEGLRR